MVLGSYYLTIDKPGEKGEGKVFRDFNEAIMAYNEGVSKSSAIKVRVTKDVAEITRNKDNRHTVRRILFNEHIPQDLGFVDRNDPKSLISKSFKVERKETRKNHRQVP